MKSDAKRRLRSWESDAARADSSHQVGKRSSTEQYGAGGSQVQARVPGKQSGTEHLVGSETTPALAERVAATLARACHQIATLDSLRRDPTKAAGHAWALKAALGSLEQLMAEATAHVDGARMLDECEVVLAEGREALSKSSSEAQFANPEEVARGGVRGDGVPLPHLARIQTSFGRHDVSSVRAHIGGAASEANHQLGAQAFAFDGRIAFAAPPALHLAAHEAAHIVQQRAGVALKGPTDQPGDEYEQHADLVADTVVRGDSAEPILDRVARGGSRTSQTPNIVQRKTPGGATGGSPPPASSKPDVAWAYLRANESKFLEAIERMMLGLHPGADSRIQWQTNGLSTRFRAAITAALAGKPLFIKLPELVHPDDPWYAIDQNRPLTEGTPGVVVDGREPVGPLGWVDLAGAALATIVYQRMADSLRRMVPRFATQIDWKAPDPVVLEDLVASHPMDRVTANLLIDPAVAKSVPGRNSKPAARRRSAADDAHFKHGVRFLNDWRWLGDVDANLWNFVEAKDPKDATPEEVAATLWGSLEATQYAYAIRQSGPYFRVDPPFARKFTHDPKHQIDDKHDDNVLELADSSIATDAAIAQAADERHRDKHHKLLPPDLKKLAAALDKSHRQLHRVKQYFTTPKLYTLVLPALKWVDKHRENLMGIPDTRLQDLTPVIEGQSEILFEAVGAITELRGMGDPTVLQDPDNPIFGTMREYAIVCGESHLIDSARDHLHVARRSKEQLPLALLEMSARDTGVTVNELAQSRDAQSPVMEDRQRNLQIDNHRIAALRAQQAMGQKVDPDLVSNVAASLKEQAVDSRVESLYDQIAALRNAASDSQHGFFETVASAFSSNIRALPGLLTTVLTDLIDSVQQPHRRNKDAQLKAAGADMNAQTAALNDVARLTERNLSAFLERHQLKTRLQVALSIIEAQQVRTAVVTIISQILILIGTSVAAGFIGNVVAGAVRGAMVADAATASIGMLRTARVVGGLAGMSVDAGINAGVQVAAQGGDAKEAFVANFLGAAALRAALAPLTKAAQAWGALRGEAETLEAVGRWQKVGKVTKFVAKQGAVLTTSMITGAATDYVVHRIYHSKEPPTEKQAVDWAIQGGSMAIGIFVGHWTHDFEARAVKAAEQFGYKTIRDRAFNVRKLAAEVAPGGARAGDPDAALELLIQRHEALQEEARVIEEAMKASRGAPSSLLETMRAGNVADQAVVKDAAFAQVPLRLAGLEPDDASGTIWAGATEDIAIALHQAERAGLRVEVLSHDSAARQWKILYNHEEITIVETKAEGRPRPAKADATEADRLQAKRYAESADFMQEKWEAMVKRDFDGREVIEADHLQLGYAYAGVVNQSTLPAQGKGLDNKVIIYKHKGALSGRGEQELGQPPTKFDAPGVRATEQSPKNARWIKSNELDRSLDIGRIENQTPAYRGEAVALQTRDKAAPDDPWKAENRKFRIKVRDAEGSERWFYCDGYDYVGGLGPGSTKEVEKVVVDESLRSAMMAGDQPMLLQGDDPDYTHKVKPGGDILIWGGTATGAWAAEPVKANPHAQATVLGDTRPPADWTQLFNEYSDLQESLAIMGEQAPTELKNRIAAIEAMITDAHSGSKIPRNRKSGATYDKPLRGPRGPGDVRIEFGTPSRMTPTGDGRVLVTIGTGESARTRTYDQVVIAHGQDPAKGPAAMLGKGAEQEPGVDPTKKEYAEVPQGTIALKPIWGPKNEHGRRPILGLQSIDPPGIVLKGAAYANKKMSPWVAKNERAAFEHEVDTMSSETAVTRDYGAISPDSYGVSPGMEVQRDRIPRANEVLNAGKLRLPGPDATLELGPDESQWDDRVREFFAINLKASDRWVSVKRLGGGATKAVVYHVSVDGTEVGIFKLFDAKGSAVNEQRTLDMLRAAKLKKMTVVQGRGTIKVDQPGLNGAILMDVAQGMTVKEMVQSLPSDTHERDRALKALTHAVTRVAEGLAEMHASFGDNSTEKPAMMSNDAKRSDADWFLDKAFRSGGRDYDKSRRILGDDFERVKRAAEGVMYDEFMSAEVPATVYHGDANAGNFALSGNNHSDLTMFDVDKVQWSVPDGAFNGRGGAVRGTKTGAADVARFLNSLETLAPGKLTPGDLQDLRSAFNDAYFRNYKVGSDLHRVSRSQYEKAERWYRLEMEMMIIDKPGAKERVLRLVGQKGGL